MSALSCRCHRLLEDRRQNQSDNGKIRLKKKKKGLDTPIQEWEAYPKMLRAEHQPRCDFE